MKGSCVDFYLFGYKPLNTKYYFVKILKRSLESDPVCRASSINTKIPFWIQKNARLPATLFYDFNKVPVRFRYLSKLESWKVGKLVS